MHKHLMDLSSTSVLQQAGLKIKSKDYIVPGVYLSNVWGHIFNFEPLRKAFALT